MPDSSVDPCSPRVVHQFVQLVSRRLSLEVGESGLERCASREKGQGQQYLHDFVHVSNLILCCRPSADQRIELSSRQSVSFGMKIHVAGCAAGYHGLLTTQQP